MATIRDIARLAEISPGAVSRILNNDPTLSVSSETRKRVFDIAKELNYNKAGNNDKSTFKMGILLWFSAEQELQDSYYLLTRQGVEDFCQKNAIGIVRAFQSDPATIQTLKGVDGLICIGKFSKSEVQQFINICSNIVFLDMPVPDFNITSLSMDFKSAVYTALDHLRDLGHSKIAFLGGKEYVGNNEIILDERKTSYISYMQENQLDYMSFLLEGSFTTASGYEMMMNILQNDDLPTAVFAANDAIAFGAIKAIKEHALSVPEDISVIGFNDIEMCSYITPALTTIHAPAYDMGQHGANLVYVASNLSINTPLKAKIPCHLVVRESCGQILN